MAAIVRNQQKIKLALTGAAETCIATLAYRAVDAESPDPILGDTWARKTLERFDNVDTAKYLQPNAYIAVALRGRYMDNWASEFLDRHGDATVLNLACGLDSRCLRVRRDHRRVRWVDVDQPDVVALREELLPTPEGDYSLIKADLTDDAWLEAVPADRPTLVVAEGLVHYLEETAGQSLVKRVVDRFSTGQLVFDCVNSKTLALQKHAKPLQATGSTLKWAIDDPKSLEKLNPRLKLMDALRIADLEGFNRYPFREWLSLWIIRYLPGYRNMVLYNRFSF